MKINEDQKKEIKELSKEGKTIREIGNLLGIKPSTVHYHLNPEGKKKSHKKYWDGLSKEKKSEISKKYRKYKRDYFRKKYNEDETFRENKKQKSREYYRGKKGESNNISKN